jgi:hypothetical protein
MPVYLELFHGRKSVDETLNDWGSQGPILGPLKYVHTTYLTDMKVAMVDGLEGVLRLGGGDLLYYDNIYYGDWSVFGPEELQTGDTCRLKPFEAAKAVPPDAGSTPAQSVVPHTPPS